MHKTLSCSARKQQAAQIALRTALAAAIAVALAPAVASAAGLGSPKGILTASTNITAECTFSCNASAHWTLDRKGNLAISGSGPIECEEELFDIGDGVQHLYIEKGITSIGSDVFSFFVNMASVEFEKGSELESIGLCAFTGCRSLQYIDIPNGVTSIGTAAFSDCSSLKHVVLDKENSSLTAIGPSAFNECELLESIVIPDGVAKIGNYAFNGCDSLTSITIPSSVTEVGQGAFEDCTGLQKVEIEDPNKTSIAVDAFTGTTGAKPSVIHIKSAKAAGKKRLKVTWTKVKGATRYVVKLKAKGTGKVVTVKAKGAKSTSKTIGRLASGRTYQVKVTALKGSTVLCTSLATTSAKVK